LVLTELSYQNSQTANGVYPDAFAAQDTGPHVYTSDTHRDKLELELDLSFIIAVKTRKSRIRKTKPAFSGERREEIKHSQKCTICAKNTTKPYLTYFQDDNNLLPQGLNK